MEELLSQSDINLRTAEQGQLLFLYRISVSSRRLLFFFFIKKTPTDKREKK